MDDRGTAVMTQMGPGRIKRYKKRSRCFVVNLDWKMGNGKPVKAYLQPNDIVVLEVRGSCIRRNPCCARVARKALHWSPDSNSNSNSNAPLLVSLAARFADAGQHQYRTLHPFEARFLWTQNTVFVMLSTA